MSIGSGIDNRTKVYVHKDGYKIDIGWLDEVHLEHAFAVSVDGSGKAMSAALEDILDAAAAYSAETKRHIYHVQFGSRRNGRNLRRRRIERGMKLLEEERKRRFAAPRHNYCREYLDSIGPRLRIRRAQDRSLARAHGEQLRYRFPGLFD